MAGVHLNGPNGIVPQTYNFNSNGRLNLLFLGQLFTGPCIVSTSGLNNTVQAAQANGSTFALQQQIQPTNQKVSSSSRAAITQELLKQPYKDKFIILPTTACVRGLFQSYPAQG